MYHEQAHNISGRSVVVVDNALNVTAIEEALTVFRKDPPMTRLPTAERNDRLPIEECAALAATAWTTRAAARLSGSSLRLVSCSLHRSTFMADAEHERQLPDAVSGVRWLASVPLHSQWAANWGGELQILEESGSSEGDGTWALTLLPLPGRVIVFDASAPHARLPPTRHAFPVDETVRFLTEQPPRGVSYTLRLAFSLKWRRAPSTTVASSNAHTVANLEQGDTITTLDSRTTPHTAARPRRMPWEIGWRWSDPSVTNAANAAAGDGWSIRSLQYGSREHAHVVDGAWSERVQARLSESMLAMIDDAKATSGFYEEFATPMSLAGNSRSLGLTVDTVPLQTSSQGHKPSIVTALVDLLKIDAWVKRLDLGYDCSVSCVPAAFRAVWSKWPRAVQASRSEPRGGIRAAFRHCALA